MTTVPLRETVSVQLDGTGAGSAKVGPLSAREIWHPGTVAISANSNPVNEALCKIYVGGTNDMQFRDATVSGSTGDNTDRCNNDVIPCGSYVWAFWTGGDPNVTAIMTVTGTKEV